MLLALYMASEEAQEREKGCEERSKAPETYPLLGALAISFSFISQHREGGGVNILVPLLLYITTKTLKLSLVKYNFHCIIVVHL